MTALKGGPSCSLGFILEWARINIIIPMKSKVFLQRPEEQSSWLVLWAVPWLRRRPSHPAERVVNTELESYLLPYFILNPVLSSLMC